jgi:hypothetical protein
LFHMALLWSQLTTDNKDLYNKLWEVGGGQNRIVPS